MAQSFDIWSFIDQSLKELHFKATLKLNKSWTLTTVSSRSAWKSLNGSGHTLFLGNELVDRDLKRCKLETTTTGPASALARHKGRSEPAASRHPAPQTGWEAALAALSLSLLSMSRFFFFFDVDLWRGLSPVSLHVGETYFTTSRLYSSICLQVTMQGSQKECLQFGRIPNILSFGSFFS